MITKEPSSAFERGGCSQATGCVRRDARATAVRAFDCALHDFTSFSGFTVVTGAAMRTTFHVPPGGRNDADAADAAASAPPRTSVAIATRTHTG